MSLHAVAIPSSRSDDNIIVAIVTASPSGRTTEIHRRRWRAWGPTATRHRQRRDDDDMWCRHRSLDSLCGDSLPSGPRPHGDAHRIALDALVSILGPRKHRLAEAVPTGVRCGQATGVRGGIGGTHAAGWIAAPASRRVATWVPAKSICRSAGRRCARRTRQRGWPTAAHVRDVFGASASSSSAPSHQRHGCGGKRRGGAIDWSLVDAHASTPFRRPVRTI